MKILFEDFFLYAEINWSKPVIYENARDFCYEIDKEYNFYKITGKYSKYPHRLFYIGKTYYQYINIRLKQKDHKERINTISKNYPRFKVYVSFGAVKFSDYNFNEKRISEKRIDDIESLLIYSNDNDYLQNRSKVFSLNVKNQYKIINKGYSSPLYREIAYGIFYK